MDQVEVIGNDDGQVRAKAFTAKGRRIVNVDIESIGSRVLFRLLHNREITSLACNVIVT